MKRPCPFSHGNVVALPGKEQTQKEAPMLTFPYPFNILFPGAGGNQQAFDARVLSPTISVNYAGNPAIEREVTEDVASFGRQIGWLSDIVASLAAAAPDAIKARPAATKSLKDLNEALQKIEAIKKRRKSDAYDSARDALAALGASDKAAFGRLVRSLDADNPPKAS